MGLDPKNHLSVPPEVAKSSNDFYNPPYVWDIFWYDSLTGVVD